MKGHLCKALLVNTPLKAQDLCRQFGEWWEGEWECLDRPCSFKSCFRLELLVLGLWKELSDPLHIFNIIVSRADSTTAQNAVLKPINIIENLPPLMKAVNRSRRISEISKKIMFCRHEDNCLKLSLDITEQMQQSWQAASMST